MTSSLRSSGVRCISGFVVSCNSFALFRDCGTVEQLLPVLPYNCRIAKGVCYNLRCICVDSPEDTE